MRISMDMLNTRNKEEKMLQACLLIQQRFVIDNTNPTAEERQRYITLARQHKYRTIGYYFQSRLEDALTRNSLRQGKELVSESGIRSTYSRLQLPHPAEGFDELYYVSITQEGFSINPWQHEI